MADLIDSASGELQQASNQLTRAGVRTTVAIAAGTTRVSARIGARAVGGTVRGLVALLDAVRQATRSRSQEGEVNLRQFTRVADGKREVVPIKDAEVARQLSRELRRHGVTFAIEKNADGSRTFHVQGKDAALIEHALTIASIRVDERITRARERAGTPEQEAPDVSLAQEPGTRVIDLDEAQKATLVEALRESGQGQESPAVDELAEQVDRDGEVTLTEENVEALDTALHGGHELPEHLGDVAAAVDEEKVAIAATDVDSSEDVTLDQDVPAAELAEAEVAEASATLVLDDQERDTLVSQVRSTVEERRPIADAAAQQQELTGLSELAETIDTTSQVELTPENVQRLHLVFADHNWTPGVDGDETPEHMRWIVDAVAGEHQALEKRTVTPQQTEVVDKQQQAEAVAPSPTQQDSTPRLVEHGRAPYQHEEGAGQSYFATIDRDGVQHTIWGVDLERAIDASGAQLGDKISVEHLGSIPVTLPDGTATHRNTWNVTVTEAQQPTPEREEPVLAQTEPAQQVTPAGDRSAEQPANPYLRDDLPAQTLPAVAGDANPFGADEWEAPAEVRSERSEDAALVSDAAAKPVQEKPAQGTEQQRLPQEPTGRERELSPREATRERVAKRIDAKVTDIKEQQKSATRPTSRAPQRTQPDEQRPPQTRR